MYQSQIDDLIERLNTTDATICQMAEHTAQLSSSNLQRHDDLQYEIERVRDEVREANRKIDSLQNSIARTYVK